MKMDALLSKAARLARKRDYESAILTLKAEENRYYGSFKFFYLYAVICLHAGNFGDALENFNHARKIKIRDLSTMLGHAVLYLRHMKTIQAVNYYLEVQELDPGNKIAKKGLAIIRKNSDPDSLSDWLSVKPERLASLYPPIPAPSINSTMVIKAGIILLAVLIAGSAILFKLRIFQNPFKNQSARPVAEYVLSGQERRAPVENSGLYSYILTRDQVIDLYDKALAFFTEYRDEKAKINLNRIMESNASDGLKNRARLLLDNMEVPGFDNFNRSDNVSFDEVRNEPLIYRDVYVIWRGMATNVEVTDDQTRFDFLVGYDTRRTLEGIVQVFFDRPVALNTERPLEILGKITLTGNFNRNFHLEGVAVHQSGRLEN